jgi:hypothetical protein
MTEVKNEWYEDTDIPGIGIRSISKFSHKEFTVDFTYIESRWASWTQEERVRFAAAFARSPKNIMDDNRRRIITFLMERGDTRIWRKIALLVAHYLDRKPAINFLIARVNEGSGPLANYYQALETLSASECVPQLTSALQKHRAQVEQRPSLDIWENRFVYLDYIACSATLFKLTGEERYRSNLKAMLEHGDEPVRQMARAAVTSSGIAV